MAFRGMGGFGGPLVVRPRRGGGAFSPPFVFRPRAGDFPFMEGGSDIDWTNYETFTPAAGGAPDFSDVTGGSSTVEQPSDVFTTMGGLGDVATALGPYLGGVGKAIFGPTVKDLLGQAGSAAGAGMGQAVREGVAKHVRRLLGGRRGSEGQRYRRMNPGNFKALRRSMRRLSAFEKAARRVIHFTHPKPTARVKFRFKRRRRR